MVDLDNVSGRDLDALVSQRVLGWTVDDLRRSADGAPMVLRELPKFSQDAPAARGLQFSFEHIHPGSAMRYESRSPYKVVIRGPSGREYSASDDSEATAVCRATLKALEGEGPGLPRDRVGRDSPREAGTISPREIQTVAELMSRRAAPHQPEGILIQAMALQGAPDKEGPERALLQYAVPANEIVPIVAEQVAVGEENVAMLCVAVLERLALAGSAARAKLVEAAQHTNATIAAAANAAIANIS